MRRPFAALAIACALGLGAAGCVDTLVGNDPAVTPRALFDQVWSDFDRNYAAFEIKNIDWNAVYARYSRGVDSVRTVAALPPIIGAMFRELKDLHVNLFVPPKTFYSSLDFSQQVTHFDPNLILTAYVKSNVLTPSRNIRYGKLAPDVGYVWISTFANGNDWSAEVDAALAGLGPISAVVIDVRNNGGGSSNNAEGIAARFVDRERTYAFYKYRNGPGHGDFTELREARVVPTGRHFTGRVVVLTNRLCASATEAFLLAMKTQPGVTTVGDTTAGGLGNPMIRELPNGWQYRLPQWVEYDVNMKVLENIGIAPDVAVAIAATDADAGRDTQLERALALAKVTPVRPPLA